MRIRQGNDFIFLWAIERNGEPENFSNAVNIKLHFKNFDCVGEVKSFQIVDGNIVRVEVSPEWASRLGAYRLILSYEFENQSYSDGDQKCVVDVLAFNIVPKTSEADDVTEMAKTTDIMIGLNGLSAYEVWLKDNPGKTKEDYYNWLRQPATDAAESIGELEQTIEGNEALRVTAEQGRSDAELLRVEAEGIRDENEIDRIEAEGIRDANETARINAESDRVDAEDLRDQAEAAREEAEELRQTNTATTIQNAEQATAAANTAAGLANNAATAANTAAGDANNAAEAANTAAGLANNSATAANTAAQNADNAREAIHDDLALKANHGYESNPKTLKEVDDDTSVKVRNLITNGDFANDVNGWSGRSGMSVEHDSGRLRAYSWSSAQSSIVSPAMGGLSTGDLLYLRIGEYERSALPESSTLMLARINNQVPDLINERQDPNLIIKNLSGIAAYNGETPRIHIRTYQGEANSVWIDDVVCINLTETFGAGNEPTKEEFELLLDILGIDYFEGEITIPAQKIMQWQLKLANTAAQNANDARLAIQNDLALKADKADLAQLESDVNLFKEESNLKDAIQDSKIKDIESIISTMNPNQSAQLSVSGVSPLSLPKNAANGGMSVKLEGLTEDVGGVITNFEPTGRVRSVGKNLFDGEVNEENLKLWDLNATNESLKIKDGYYIGKSRVTNRIPIKVSKNTTYEISFFGALEGASAPTKYQIMRVLDNSFNTIFSLKATSIEQTYRGEFNSLDNDFIYLRIDTANAATMSVKIKDIQVAKGKEVSYEPYKETNLYLTAPELRSNGTVKDEIRKGSNGYVLVKRISDVDGSVLTTPEIIPISYGGVLNSAENGTVYHEPIIADAGVYETKMDILLTDYPIASIVEIIKHENGVDTYLDIATAVVASDGLSFTHPDLADGDLVLFTYAFDKESTNGNITATFYDSNVVKIDTVTGKAYKIEDVVTNGVLTRTLIEV